MNKTPTDHAETEVKLQEKQVRRYFPAKIKRFLLREKWNFLIYRLITLSLMGNIIDYVWGELLYFIRKTICYKGMCKFERKEGAPKKHLENMFW